MVKIRKNDEVVIISGKNRGQAGRVLSINRKKNTVKIDKINIIKKHVKPSQTNPNGGIQEFEGPIHISNVALNVKGKEGGPTRVSVSVDNNGNKKRIAKKTGKEI